jgi:hypothetical protein
MLLASFRHSAFRYIVSSVRSPEGLRHVHRKWRNMDKIFAGLPGLVDKTIRGTPEVTIPSILVLGGTIYLLFGTAAEFMKLMVFVIVQSPISASFW